jgi:hypothetical protein
LPSLSPSSADTVPQLDDSSCSAAASVIGVPLNERYQSATGDDANIDQSDWLAGASAAAAR